MPPFLWWVVYNGLQLLGLPLLALWLLYRKVALGKGEGWGERFGGSPVTPKEKPQPIWVHAVSAGEAAAAAPLVKELKRRWPDAPLVLSTLTPAGREMAQKLCPQAEAVFYFPWDLLFAVHQSLNRVRPRAVVMMEGEFWPDFLSTCRSKGIPVLVANGRISDKGYRRARRIAWVMPWMYGLVSVLGMQSEEDARRAIGLGAPEDRVRVIGQTKFDAESGPLSREETSALRHELLLPEDATVIVGGSTRPGEEAALLDALASLRPETPNLRLILAPRHLERVPEIEALVNERGYRLSKRTAPEPDYDVLLLDTMGELGKIYAVGDLCFVGGTLANIGGHNLLQPLAQGKPVVFGPHTQNVRDIAALVLQTGVGIQVQSSEELTERMREALRNPEAWVALEAKALEVVEANKGASARYVDVLETLL